MDENFNNEHNPEENFNNEQNPEENENTSGEGQNGESYREDEPTEYAYKTVMDVKEKSRIFSVISAACAAVSVVFCCTPWSALAFGVIAIVFAIVSRNRIGYFDTLGLVGLVVGIFGTVFGITGFILTYLIENTDIFADILKELEQSSGAGIEI